MNTPDRNMAFYSFDSNGVYHTPDEESPEPDRYSTPPEDALFIAVCVALMLAGAGLIWLVVHFATVIDSWRR
jgi:hypothetical protein